MSDEDRIAYLAGDDECRCPTTNAPSLDELRDLLADPSLWADPSAGLEDRVGRRRRCGRRRRHLRRAMPDRTAPPPRRSPPGRAAPAVLRAPDDCIAAAPCWSLALGVIAGLVARRSPGGEHFRWRWRRPAGSPQAVTGAADARRTDLRLAHRARRARALPRLDGGRFYQAWLRNGDGMLVPIGTFNEGRERRAVGRRVARVTSRR